MAEYVYLMEGADAIKVGISDNPERRLREVAGRLGDGARVVRTVACSDRARAFELESGLHKVLAPYRLEGERFGVECFTLRSKPFAEAMMGAVESAPPTSVSRREFVINAVQGQGRSWLDQPMRSGDEIRVDSDGTLSFSFADRWAEPMYAVPRERGRVRLCDFQDIEIRPSESSRWQSYVRRCFGLDTGSPEVSLWGLEESIYRDEWQSWPSLYALRYCSASDELEVEAVYPSGGHRDWIVPNPTTAADTLLWCALCGIAPRIGDVRHGPWEGSSPWLVYEGVRNVGMSYKGYRGDS